MKKEILILLVEPGPGILHKQIQEHPEIIVVKINNYKQQKTQNPEPIVIKRIQHEVAIETITNLHNFVSCETKLSDYTSQELTQKITNRSNRPP